MSLLARFVIRHPRKIVAFWVLLLLASSALASGLGGRVQNGGYSASGSQSQRAAALSKRLFADDSSPQAYLAVLSDGASTPTLLRNADAAAAAIRGLSGVKSLGKPLPAPNGRAVLIPVTLAGSIGAAQTYVPAIQSALARLRLPATDTQLIGQAAVYQRYMVQSKRSLQTSSLISFPVTLVILLVAFLSLVAALLPLGLAAVCVGCTFGLLYLISYVVQLSVFVEDTVLILGLGLSIDFSLFMVSRVRETLARNPASLEAAITEALQTTGRAITISGLTVSAALGGLYVTGLGIFASLATGAIGGALIAVSAALTLTPAVLLLLGERLDRFSLPLVVNAARSGSFWRRLADFVVRRRVPVVLTIVPLMLVLSLPLGGMHIVLKSFSVLPASDPVRASSERVAGDVGPGVGTPAIVLAHSSAPRLRAVLSAQPGVVNVGPAESGREGWVRMSATLSAAADSSTAIATVHRLRTALASRLGASAVVGGPTAEGIDLIDRINARTPLVVLVVLLAEILFLTLVFGAPIIALKAALTTLLSVGASLGVMTFCFRGTGDIGYFVPLFLFTTVFGLSTDYEVFLLSRLREHHREGADNTASLKRALVGSARSITLAGITMGVVFFSFAVSPLVPFQELGVGMGLAIVLDVTVVRGLLVPATVALLGEANWWRPRRRLARPAERLADQPG
jgi:uncharacterized membrane protein YdfJ with MMPL/SSD domain